MRRRPLRLRRPDGSLWKLTPQTRAQMLAAVGLVQRFNWQHGAQEVTPMREDLKPPKVVAGLGRCVAVIYESDKEGEAAHYIHEFNPKSRPWLCASPDGKRLFLLGYRGRVQRRGITG